MSHSHRFHSASDVAENENPTPSLQAGTAHVVLPASRSPNTNTSPRRICGRPTKLTVFLPRIRFKRATRQGTAWVTEALFPGYLFARFDWRTSLRLVQHSRGVRGVVHFGERWPAIPDDDHRELQQDHRRRRTAHHPAEFAARRRGGNRRRRAARPARRRHARHARPRTHRGADGISGTADHDRIASSFSRQGRRRPAPAFLRRAPASFTRREAARPAAQAEQHRANHQEQKKDGVNLEREIKARLNQASRQRQPHQNRQTAARRECRPAQTSARPRTPAPPATAPFPTSQT